MKTRIIILLLFCFAKGALSQTYQPFPTDSAVWRQSSANWNYPDYYQRDYNYYSQGDTFLLGNTYHKIYKTEIDSYYVLGSPTGPFNLTTGPTMVDSNKYMGAIREDPSKHVYYLPDTATASEILLYDFNLNIGDTLGYSYNNSSYFLGYNRVTGIDSVIVGTQYHKQFRISAPGYPNYVSIIEGVGSTFGLLEMFIDPFEWSDNLICFSHNGQSVWADSVPHPPKYIAANCALPTPLGIKEQSGESRVFVFPNPSSGTLYLKTASSEKTDIQLVDVFGKTIYKTTVSTKETTINLSSFPQGIYFLKATSGNTHSEIKKIVLQ